MALEISVERVVWLQVQSAVQILELAVSSTVVVVGSGPAGVELATTVADKLGKRSRVSLISTGDTLLPSVLTNPVNHQCFGGQMGISSDGKVGWQCLQCARRSLNHDLLMQDPRS